MSEWQPIETAPKDGTWIIGYRKPRRDEERPPVAAIFFYLDTETEIVPLGDDIFRRVKSQVGKWFQENWDEFRPTHWVALPTPPEAKP